MTKSILTVLRFELVRAWAAPSTYLFLALMVAATAVATFFLGGFYGSNQASLDILFRYIPWIYVFFAPALVMGSWSEDIRRGTAEILFSLPIPLSALHLGKFLAAWILLACMLGATALMPLTVMFLGTPDIGVMVAGYIGCALLGGVMLAVGMWASAFARTQTGAYALALVAGFLLLAVGWGLMTSMLQSILPDTLITALVDKGLLARYELMTRGLILLQDVVFMLCVGGGFLFLAYAHLCARYQPRKNRVLFVLPRLALFVVAYQLVAFVPFRMDTTADQTHTLSPGTHEMLSYLPATGATLTLYYSSQQHLDATPQVRQFVMQLRDFLQVLRRSDPRLHIEEKAPEANINDLLTVETQQLVPLPQPSGEALYLGMVMRVGDQTTVIPVFDVKHPEQIEYQVMATLAEIIKGKNRKKIAVITELDLGDAEQRPRIMLDLTQQYDVDVLRMGAPQIPENTDLVIVFFSPFMELENLYAIDQYVMQGGHVLVMLDPFLRTAVKDYHLMLDRHADAEAVDHIADLLRAWGAEYDYRYLVMDPALATVVQHEDLSGTAAYPLWLTLDKNNMAADIPMSANLDRIMLPESGFFTPTGTQTYTPVLFTSMQAQVVSRTALRDVDGPLLASKAQGRAQRRDLAVLLNGTFNSAFKAVPERVVRWYNDYGVPVPTHQAQAVKAGAVMAIADVDFAGDFFSTNRQGDKVVPNDNYYLLRNMIEYMVGDISLLSIRGRASHERPFVMVSRLAQNTVARFAKAEQDLLARQFMVREEITKLQKLLDEDSPHIGPSAQQDIKTLQLEELKIRQEIQKVRREGRSAVETLGRVLALLNIGLMPLGIALVGVGVMTHRRRKWRKTVENS